MADCVSNAAELVEELKVCASDCSYLQNSFDLHNSSIMFRAADAIEQLIAENAKLKEIADSTYNGAKTRIAKLEEMNNGLLADREILRTDNAKLKEERDAAVADLQNLIMGFNSCICDSCKHMTDEGCELLGCQWEWRGVKEDNR